MKSRILFLIASVVAVNTVAAERWRSPDRFYSIVPPDGWKQSENKSDVGPSFVFTSPDENAEIRISATYHLNLPDVLPDDVLGLAFPEERGITPIQRVRGENWDGLRREYTDLAENTRWIGVAARRGSTAVLLTMEATSKDFEHLRSIFESVGQSLTLGEKNIVSDKQADEFIQLALTGFWGKALDENNHPIQPKDEDDRKTVPIPIADARRVAHAGVPAGVAAWADLDWETYYQAFMKKERSSRRWSGKQIAFIGLLFGVAQGSTTKSLENTPRDKEALDRAVGILADARNAF